MCSQRKEFAWIEQNSQTVYWMFPGQDLSNNVACLPYISFQAITLLLKCRGDVLSPTVLKHCIFFYICTSEFKETSLTLINLELTSPQLKTVLPLTDWVSRAICFNLQVLRTFLPLEKDIDEEEGFGVIVSQVACSLPWFKIDFPCESILVLSLCGGWGVEMLISPVLLSVEWMQTAAPLRSSKNTLQSSSENRFASSVFRCKLCVRKFNLRGTAFG